MCNVLGKSRRKSFTGYKAVIELNSEYEGKYYSPSTGYQYKLGKLPNMKESTIFADSRNWGEVFKEKSPFYNDKMQGKTGLFKTIKDLRDSFTYIKTNYTILKITLGGDIYNGEFQYTDIMLGTEITKIEKTKYKTNI